MGVHIYARTYRWDNNHVIQNHSYSYWINRHLQQTHNTPHSDTLVYHPTGTYIHTSSSSFTLHLPPSRTDWTSCSLPSAAATSRSLTTEALDAACHVRNSIQIYVYSVGWDGIIYSSRNPQSITMYVLLAGNFGGKIFWRIAENMSFGGIYFGGWASLSHNDIHNKMANQTCWEFHRAVS